MENLGIVAQYTNHKTAVRAIMNELTLARTHTTGNTNSMISVPSIPFAP